MIILKSSFYLPSCFGCIFYYQPCTVHILADHIFFISPNFCEFSGTVLFPSKNWIKSGFLKEIVVHDSILRKTKDRRLRLNSFRKIPNVENCQQVSAGNNCTKRQQGSAGSTAALYFLLVYRDSRIGQSRPISAAIKVFSSQDLAS